MRTLPSQIGHWTFERDPIPGRIWLATHSDVERGDIGGGEDGPARAGGPESLTASTLADLLVEIVQFEAELGDFAEFAAAVELVASGATHGGLDGDALASEILSVLDLHALDGAERVALAIEDALYDASLTGGCGCGQPCPPDDVECHACRSARLDEEIG